MQAAGRLQRRIAASVSIPPQPEPSTSGSSSGYGAGRLHRCHRLPVTAVALTADDTTAFTVSKDGARRGAEGKRACLAGRGGAGRGGAGRGGAGLLRGRALDRASSP
jgi:hypothetical protein